MSWTIITEAETADFARVTEAQLQDDWYDMALAMVEQHTGWRSLEAAVNATEYVDGSGTYIIKQAPPINSVSLVQIHGETVPAAYYYVNWYGIEMRTYIPGDSYQLTLLLDRKTGFNNIFPFGIKNVYLEYNYGGTASLPTRYQDSLKWAMLQIVKEISTVPKTEGSDSMLKKYRPDRTMLPEEVLRMYGIHGKILGILSATLPSKKLWG